MNKIDSTLAERSSTHGSFVENAYDSQRLKRVVRRCNSYESMTLVQREALDMIMHKISRITCGNPHEPDHWLDIAGYAILVYKDLSNETV
jgi:hypothetical protein